MEGDSAACGGEALHASSAWLSAARRRSPRDTRGSRSWAAATESSSSSATPACATAATGPAGSAGKPNAAAAARADVVEARNLARGNARLPEECGCRFSSGRFLCGPCGCRCDFGLCAVGSRGGSDDLEPVELGLAARGCKEDRPRARVHREDVRAPARGPLAARHGRVRPLLHSHIHTGAQRHTPLL